MKERIMSDLISTGEAAELIGVSHVTMHNWRKAGTGPAFKRIGGTTKQAIHGYRLDVIQAFIASRGSSKIKMEARRSALAREADKLQAIAVTAIGVARAARAAAAKAGHQPSTEILNAGGF
jgi:DNA-binding transcriptional MerR regulator